MKPKQLIQTLLMFSLFAGICSLTASAEEKDSSKLEAKAKVSKAAAKKAVIKLWKQLANDSEFLDSELEEEGGKLIWSFDIAMPDSKNVLEVQVNAKTGKVSSVATETPADQEKEAKADAKEAKTAKKVKKSESDDDDQKTTKKVKKSEKDDDDDEKEAKASKKDGKAAKAAKKSEKDDDDKDEKK